MANEIFKEIKTRIALKTLDLAGWEAIKETYKPLKGEVCVCEIPTGNNVPTANSVTPPTVLFKVGDGVNFWKDLNWASALAADVYTWAKATEAEHKEWLKTNHADLDTRYNFSTEGDKLVVTKDLFVNGVKSGDTLEVGKYEFLSETEVRTILADYYTKEEVDGLINGVVGDKDKDTKDSNTIIGAKKYTDAAVEGIVSGSGYATQTWVTGEIEKLDKADTAVDGQYVSAVSEENGIITVTRANLPTSADYGVLDVNGDAESGVVVDKTDAQRPTIKIAANTYDVHGAASEAEGRINETLKNYYTKSEADAAFTTPEEVIAEVNKALSEVSSSDAITNITTLVEYVNEHGGDLTGLITEVYGSAEMTGDSRLDTIEAKAAMGITSDDIQSWNTTKSTVDTNKATWDKANTALQASDLTAYDTSKNFGDIITHDAAEFATNAENGAKALADQNKLAIDAINDVDTGILAQAKKDAADKAAVVLGEAQKYADDKVAVLAGEGNDTTVAALAGRVNTLETAGHLTEVVANNTDEKHSGLKVTDNNKIEIDDEVIFVLDCNW